LPAPVFDYNDVWNNDVNYTGVTPGPHSKSVDPAFINSKAADYHLRYDSPVIDMGTNTGAPAHDFEGEIRPLDGNRDNIAITDMGADEFRAKPRLTVAKQAGANSAQTGLPLTYTLFVTNTGNVMLATTIRDILPKKVSPTPPPEP
jgi:uncharacterized repeat protein (TIGR01451 family)